MYATLIGLTMNWETWPFLMASFKCLRPCSITMTSMMTLVPMAVNISMLSATLAQKTRPSGKSMIGCRNRQSSQLKRLSTLLKNMLTISITGMTTKS